MSPRNFIDNQNHSIRLQPHRMTISELQNAYSGVRYRSLAESINNSLLLKINIFQFLFSTGLKVKRSKCCYQKKKSRICCFFSDTYCRMKVKEIIHSYCLNEIKKHRSELYFSLLFSSFG